MAVLNTTAWSPRRASLVAGIALALMAVLAGVAKFAVLDPLITPGDAARTANDILASEGLFRSAIAALILTATLDIVVTIALLALFTPVNRSVATMAAAFRLAFAAVFLVAISQLVSVLAVLGDADQALRAVDAFDTIWLVGLILFGVHLLLIGYLAYRSGFVPRIIGVLLVVAGLGYVVDGFGTVLFAHFSTIGQFTFVGEVALIFWLLIKGVRMNPTGHAGDAAGVAGRPTGDVPAGDETPRALADVQPS
jgi:hypothetical protein